MARAALAKDRRNGTLSLLALGFVVGAWGVVAAGDRRVSELDLSRWGDDIDIPESLAINIYIARHFQPYIRSAMALDGLALAALCWATRRGRLGALGLVVGAVWLFSTGWHGLTWWVTSLFAAAAVHF